MQQRSYRRSAVVPVVVSQRSWVCMRAVLCAALLQDSQQVKRDLGCPQTPGGSRNINLALNTQQVPQGGGNSLLMGPRGKVPPPHFCTGCVRGIPLLRLTWPWLTLGLSPSEPPPANPCRVCVWVGAWPCALLARGGTCACPPAVLPRDGTCRLLPLVDSHLLPGDSYSHLF